MGTYNSLSGDNSAVSEEIALNPSSTKVPPSTPISSHSFPASKEETALRCTQSSALTPSHFSIGFSDGTMVKNLLAKAGNARDEGLIPGSGRSPGEGNCKPLQYSCLKTPIDRGAWRATVHGVTKSQTGLNAHTLILPMASLLCDTLL